MMECVFHIVLVHPEIPPNTGNIIRLAAGTGCSLHLIEPLGFEMSDRRLRRAGLDYHEFASVHTHPSWEAWRNGPVASGGRMFALSTSGLRTYADVDFAPGDAFVFGSESAGLPAAVEATFDDVHRLRLPMLPGRRSLNICNSVGVVVYEAWRRCGFAGGI